MNTGQTMLSIAALSFLSLITLRYYSSVGQAGMTLSQSNAGINATTIATSFIERAQNTHFDEHSYHISEDSILANPLLLTWPANLGVDSAFEVTYDDFNDFDDFNDAQIDYTTGYETYKVSFKVNYVDTANINNIVTNHPTLLKRMDIRVWRTYPPVDTTNATSFDTLEVSTLFGYFKFNPI
jgi:hypothetical protein